MTATTRIALATWLVGTAAFAATPQLVEGIVVRVNDRILTTSDMRQRAAERAAETGIPVPPGAYPELAQEAADELCILERAAELKLEVSSEEINAAVKQLRDRNNVTDDATFAKMLSGMGLTLEDLKAKVRNNILIQRLLQREVGDLPITEAELRQRYEQEKGSFVIGERVHLEHIVLPVLADRSDLDAQLGAGRRLAAAARASGDFLGLVKQEVAAGHGNGGDLGTLLLTDLRPEVREAVAKLKPGEVSEPFTSSAGVHVVRLVERIAPTVKPFEQVEKDLRERELDKRYRDHLESVVAELKKRYVVEVHPELLATNK